MNESPTVRKDIAYYCHRQEVYGSDETDAFIFGYTCVNDVTAADILNRDATFAQWARAKSCDGYGPFGPVIASGIDPSTLVVRTILNSVERQNYPIADMIFSAQELVKQDLARHDFVARRPDLLRNIGRCWRHGEKASSWFVSASGCARRKSRDDVGLRPPINGAASGRSIRAKTRFLRRLGGVVVTPVPHLP